MNFNFTVQDDAKVIIGNHCNFGPNVTLVTPLHPMLPEERSGIVCEDEQVRFCYAKPIVIGDDCWFGANVVVCPGVTIGYGLIVHQKRDIIINITDNYISFIRQNLYSFRLHKPYTAALHFSSEHFCIMAAIQELDAVAL